MLTRTQSVFVAILAGVLCTGCGGSSTSGNLTTAGTGADNPKNAAKAVPRGQTPSPSVAVVTFHVKDMGTKLNLL